MKTLNRAILEDYEIEVNRPTRTCAVQFGDDARLLGVVDRLLDDANKQGCDVGIAAVQAGETGFARFLAPQDGIFTTYIRGDLSEKEVRRTQVVQSVTQALNPAEDDDALMALSRSGEIQFGIMNLDETGEYAQRDGICAALAARFLVERMRSGIAPMAMIVCGDSADCADKMRRKVAEIAEGWCAGENIPTYINGCRWFSALADGMAVRSDAEAAARLCRQENYADAMIHLAEPYALWAIAADADFRRAFPLDRCGQIRFVDNLVDNFEKKHRLQDAGLFAMYALGALHGDETLSDCMADEPLRDQLGRALYDEVLPFAPIPREEASAYLIECCERWENPLHRTELFENCGGLLRKFTVGVLPTIRAYTDEHFALPEHLCLALAATVLLYAGVRLENGRYAITPNDAPIAVHDDPDALAAFAKLSPDMPSESLAYAVLADRALWRGANLREIDGLEEFMARNLAMIASMLAPESEA